MTTRFGGGNGVFIVDRKTLELWQREASRAMSVRGDAGRPSGPESGAVDLVTSQEDL